MATQRASRNRPAVVVSTDEYNRKAGMALICPITSKRKGYPFEVDCEVESVAGAILVDQIRALDWHARSFRHLSVLSEQEYAEVQAKLLTLMQ